MQKFQEFKKLSKSQGCSFYKAINRETRKYVLLKKLPQKQTWDNLLHNPNFIYSNKEKMFLKNIQVFKRKESFFIVTEAPNGPSLIQPRLMEKLPPSRFYPIYQSFLDSLIQLKKFKQQIIILPQWLFFHHNSIKIGHFQPFFEQENGDKLQDHVYLFNNSKQQSKQKITHSSLQLKKNSNIVFTLGCIAYSLITGKPSIKGQQEQEYLESLLQLEQHGKRRLIKACQDQILAQMITKMIGKDTQEPPKFQHIKNFIDRKAKEFVYPNKHNQNLQVQFSLQKMILNNKHLKIKKKRKFVRKCCNNLEEQDEGEIQQDNSKQINNSLHHHHPLRKNNQLDLHYHTNRRLSQKKSRHPQINRRLDTFPIAPTTRNKSLFPFLSTRSNQQSSLKKTHILSLTHISRPLMFQKNNKKMINL